MTAPDVAGNGRDHPPLPTTPGRTVEVTKSDRGVQQGTEIPSTYGGFIRVYESSAAGHPHIWANIKCPVDFNEPLGPQADASVHLRIEDAERLHAQLGHIINNHNQRDDGPESADPGGAL